MTNTNEKESQEKAHVSPLKEITTVQTRREIKKTKHLVELLNQHRAGNQGAFSLLHRASRPHLLSWLKRKFPNAPLRAYCSDAAQEALARLASGPETFGTDRQLRAWLQKTAKHRALNAHRRRRPPANSVLIETALGGVL